MKIKGSKTKRRRHSLFSHLLVFFIIGLVISVIMGFSNFGLNGRKVAAGSTITDVDQTMYIVTIKYMYDRTGEIADSKDVYCFGENEDINLTIKQFDGFTSNIDSINEFTDSAFVERVNKLDYVKVEKQSGFNNVYKIYYTVSYTPSLSSYKVVTYLQKASDLTSYDTESEVEYTEDVYIGDKVSVKAQEKEGYTINTERSKLSAVVSGDGKTKLEIYYDLNQPYMYLDSDGGTYYEPLAVPYTANIQSYLQNYTPEKAGYTFTKWNCIQTTDDGDEIVVDTPETMPNEDVYFKAVYEASTTSFTVVYFLENANNNNYTNVGTYVINGAPTGSLVSDFDTTRFEEEIAKGMLILKPDEKQFFQYDRDRSRSNYDVYVKGDGTTNVNVYYDRKEYTIRFMVGRYSNRNNQIALATGGSESACSWQTVDSAATITINNNTYTNADYQIKAKYNQDISTLWPSPEYISDVTHSNTTYYFMTWGTNSSSPYWHNNTNHNIQGRYYTMSSDLIINADDPSQVHEMYGYWSTSPRYFKFHILYDMLDQSADAEYTHDGKKYDDVYNYIVVATSTKSGMNPPNIWGVTNVYKAWNGQDGQGGTTRDSAADIYFYYDRIEYELTLNNIVNDYVPSEDIIQPLNNKGYYIRTLTDGKKHLVLKYGASISDLLTIQEAMENDEDNKLQYPLITQEGEIRPFDKWYLDAAFRTEFPWEDSTYTTMDQNLVIYANWIVPKHDAVFDTKNGRWRAGVGGNTGYTLEDGKYKTVVNSGSLLKKPSPQPTRDGYTFKGWYYTNDLGEYVEYLFSDSQKVYKDLQLDAVWEARQEGTYRVRYVLAKYDDDGNLIKDPASYSESDYLQDEKVVTNVKYGTVVTEDAVLVLEGALQNMYFVDRYEKNLEISTNPDENILYFFYTPQPNMKYIVYYVENTGKVYENGEVPSPDVILHDSKEGEFKRPGNVIEQDTYEDIFMVVEESIEIDGYEVDAYKKMMVLTSDRDNELVNVIYFYYSPVERKGDYKINYYFMQDDGTYPESPDFKAEGEDSVGKYIYATDYYEYLSEESPLYVGHEFDSEKSSVLMVIVSTEGTATIDLYFKNIIYDVYYDTEDGDFTDESMYYSKEGDNLYLELVSHGKLAHKPSDPTKEGFRFDGWYNRENDEKFDFETPITKNTNLYAKWVETKKINITKIWDDASNQDGKRPVNVICDIKNGDEVAYTVELNNDNGWTTSIDVDKYEPNTQIEINYEIEEREVNEYNLTSKVNDEGTNNWTLTNTHTPLTKNITVIKEWDDDNNRDGKRPQDLEIKLSKNGEYLKSCMLNQSNSYTFVFEDLPVYEGGDEITYDVEEVDITDYEQESKNFEEASNIYTFKNKHTPLRTNKTVTKIWRDGSNSDSTRPDSITFVLLKNGERYSDEITLNASNSNGNSDEWEYTFNDLYVYEDGNEISWTVEETVVPAGYGVIYNQNKLDIYNCYPPEVQVSVEKVWNDENDADGIRPERIEVQLYADGAPYMVGDTNVGLVELTADTGWKYVWPFVEKYNDQMEEYVYEVKEVDLGEEFRVAKENYDVDIQLKKGENEEFQRTYIVTNTYVPQKTSVSVRKEWNDENDQDGKRPENVTLNLCANGRVVQSAVLDDGNGWQHTFDNVNVNENGTPIDYTITENDIAGYTYTVTKDENDVFVVTNTHTPEKRVISVKKEWNDNFDQDGKRPQDVTMILTSNDGEVQRITLNEANGWAGSFDEVFAYNAGEKVSYDVNEQGFNDYFQESKIYNDETDTYTITNKHEIEKTDITITKVWQDDDNRDGLRPRNVRVSLKNGEDIVEDDIVLNDANGWSKTITDLDVYKDKEKIVYEVSEIEQDGYTSDTVYDDGTKTFTITNTHTPSKRNITVTKEWKDNDNQDGKRKGSVTINLLKNGETYKSVELNDGNAWKYTFSDEFEYENKAPITYTISENDVEGYTPNVIEIRRGEFILENEHTPETKTILVVKKWNDKENQDRVRPESVKVNLMLNGKVEQTLTLNEENGWHDRFREVPVYEAGTKLNYSVEEEAVPGYLKEDIEYNDENHTYTITNNYEVQKAEITITKIWQDEENRDGLRPANAYFVIKKDGEIVKDNIVLNSTNGWTTTISDLDKNSNGVEINYTVEEKEISEKYTSNIEYDADTKTYNVTNTYTPEKKVISVKKEWNDNENQDGKRPESVEVTLTSNGEEAQKRTLNAENEWSASFDEVYVYENGGSPITYDVSENEITDYTLESKNFDEVTNTYTITNKHEIEKVSRTITKIWQDDNNRDGIRPESLNFVLKKNDTVLKDDIVLSDANGWSTTISNLDKYEAQTQIVYTLEEEKPGEYTSDTQYSEETQTYTITNTYEPKKKVISVRKEWDDNENQDGKRPGSVEVNLTSKGNILQTITLNNDNSWSGSFEEVFVNEDGEPISYDVSENDIAEYTLEDKHFEDDTNTFVITNKHDIEKTERTISKVWDDENDRDGIRPETIKFTLKNGEKVVEDNIILDSSSNNSTTIYYLDKYEAGNEINYTLEEDTPDEYTSDIKYDSNTKTFNVTNTYEPKKKVISVRKEWIDNEDQDRRRPESIEVTLLANNAEGQKITLNKENNFTASFDEVYVYENGGEPISYDVSENEISYYTLESKDFDNETNTFTLKNKHEIEKAEIIITKTWQDEDDRDGIRPENAYFVIKRDGEVVKDNVILNEENGWAITITDLDKNSDGVEINYIVEEVELSEKYTSKIEYNSDTKTFKATNTYTPQKKVISVKKEWNDNNNQDGKRPESVEVTLTSNGREIQKKTLDAENEFSASFDEVYVYENGGEAIIYDVLENELTDYTLESKDFDDATNTFTLKNKHEIEKTYVIINKIWQDDDNRDGIRPKTVKFTLKNGDKVVNDNIILDSNSITISDLDKYEAGNEINYTLEEQVPNGYTSDIIYDSDAKTFNVTNSHEVEKISLNITKEFVDEGFEGYRPDTIYVNVYLDGNIFMENVELLKNEDYKKTIDNLFKNANGSKIDYSVEEQDIDIYDSEVTKNENDVTVKNSIITYKITTKVNGEGGTITAQDEEYVERVVLGYSQTSDVVITPDTGYEISKITINGEEQALPDDRISPYTLPKIENIYQDYEISVEFCLRKFEITTEVLSENGTISGQYDDVYEYVEYGKDSVEDIEIVPDQYFEISKILVNGVEQELPDDRSLPYVLDKFKSVKENIHVQVEFQRIKARIIVKYEKTDGTKIIDDIVIEDVLLGDEYETEYKEFENYYLVSVPENASGIIEENTVIVSYIYEYKPDIYITKKLKAKEEDLNEQFEISVKITNELGNYTEDLDYEILNEKDEVVSEGKIVSGEGVIKISNNQTILIYKVPENFDYEISELNAEDYVTKINKVNEKQISGKVTENIYIDIENEKIYVNVGNVDTSDINITKYILTSICSILFVIFSIVLIKKSKKQKIK